MTGRPELEIGLFWSAIAIPLTWAGLEWIEQVDVEVREIADVARDYGELVPLRRRRDHRVLIQRIRASMHEPRPFAKGLGVHRKDVVRRRDHVGPLFDFGGLGDILLPGEF